MKAPSKNINKTYSTSPNPVNSKTSSRIAIELKLSREEDWEFRKAIGQICLLKNFSRSR